MLLSFCILYYMLHLYALFCTFICVCPKKAVTLHCLRKRNMFNYKIEKVMKTQINSLVKGDHKLNIVGTPHEVRNAIANAVVSENHDSLHINIKGLDLTLAAHWSLSGKSVEYTINLTDEQAKVLGEDLSGYTYQHKAVLFISSDMYVYIFVYARKTENHQWGERFYHYLNESDVTIL